MDAPLATVHIHWPQPATAQQIPNRTIVWTPEGLVSGIWPSFDLDQMQVTDGCGPVTTERTSRKDQHDTATIIFERP